MTTVNQGMGVEEIKRVVAQRVANAIEAIAIYEAKTNIALKSMSQTKRQKENVAENASNKRKWEGNHNGSSNQQNKGHKVSPSNVSTMNPSSVSYVTDDVFWFKSTNDNVSNTGPVKETFTSSGTSYDHIRPTRRSHWNDNVSSTGLAGTTQGHNIEATIFQSVNINTKPTSYAGATSLNTTMVNNNSIPATGTTTNFQFVKVDKVYDGVDISMPR
nr:hypothetical protein [Tanacetum cinerariifolium]